MPAAVQLECRARLEVGEVPVFAAGEKRELTHIALDVQRCNHVEFCGVQAKFDIDVAYTLDASQDVEKNADGIPVRDGRGGQLCGGSARR